jgi:hypothetical protein
MSTIVLTSDPGPDVAGRGVLLASELTGAPPDRVMALPNSWRTAAESPTGSFAGADVVVVAAAVANGGVAHAVSRLRSVSGSSLSGVIAFALTIGDDPFDAAGANADLRSALLAAGATCLAPGLHLSAPSWESDWALRRYAACWEPVVGGLAAAGAHRRARAA